MNRNSGKARTPAEIAAVFGCSEAQVSAQFVKNHESLKALYEKACRTGKKVNGYTSEELRQLINNLPFKG